MRVPRWKRMQDRKGHDRFSWFAWFFLCKH